MTAVDDLAAWLTQIWDEQEATARAVAVEGRPLEGGSGSWFESDRSIGDKTGYVVAYGVEWDAARKHIVNHDPASVLARIAADRQILELHTGEHSCQELQTGTYPDDWPESASWGKPGAQWRHASTEYFEDEPCPTARLLAQPYADRPGCQDSWRPVSPSQPESEPLP